MEIAGGEPGSQCKCRMMRRIRMRSRKRDY
jgi:hypothetical protein